MKYSCAAKILILVLVFILILILVIISIFLLIKPISFGNPPERYSADAIVTVASKDFLESNNMIIQSYELQSRIDSDLLYDYKHLNQRIVNSFQEIKIPENKIVLYEFIKNRSEVQVLFCELLLTIKRKNY